MVTHQPELKRGSEFALDYMVSPCRKSMLNELGLQDDRAAGPTVSRLQRWTIALKALAPVAGITDLENQVVDGAIAGHCDWTFHINTYRWDFPQVAALIAPRPMLICNTDKDRLFPLDGVVRLHKKVADVYELQNATNMLGLLITEGGHLTRRSCKCRCCVGSTDF